MHVFRLFHQLIRVGYFHQVSQRLGRNCGFFFENLFLGQYFFFLHQSLFATEFLLISAYNLTDMIQQEKKNYLVNILSNKGFGPIFQSSISYFVIINTMNDTKNNP